MNIHPIFVHFPIAFLGAYAVLELLRFNKLKNQVYYFYLKAFLVIVGELSALVTIPTGILAKLSYAGAPFIWIINIHETLAITAAVLFGFIALAYLTGWLKRSGHQLNSNNFLINFFSKIETLITEKWLGVVLALIGLALITLVGSLGGLIAFGPSNDPITILLYPILKSIFNK